MIRSRIGDFSGHSWVVGANCRDVLTSRAVYFASVWNDPGSFSKSRGREVDSGCVSVAQ
jgi:hypothetical protein